MLLKVQRHVTPALACSDGLAGAPAAAHCMLTYSEWRAKTAQREVRQ